MILPYVKVNGDWSLDDSIIAGLWSKIEAQNLHVLTFKDHEIRGVGDFFVMMQNPKNLVIICVDEDKPVAVSWLNTIAKDSAFAHYFFFKEYWGKADAFGKEILQHWFNLGNPPIFKVLMGRTPPDNKRALAFSTRLGFTVLGEIPHVGIISYMENLING